MPSQFEISIRRRKVVRCAALTRCWHKTAKESSSVMRLGNSSRRIAAEHPGE